jgi:hypothetical protein
LLTLEAAHEKGRVHRDLKPAKDMRLAREPRHAVDIGSERRGQNLDRHITPKFGIRRAPHLAHPAFALAELRNNPVMRNDGLGVIWLTPRSQLMMTLMRLSQPVTGTERSTTKRWPSPIGSQ